MNPLADAVADIFATAVIDTRKELVNMNPQDELDKMLDQVAEKLGLAFAIKLIEVILSEPKAEMKESTL